MTITHLEKNIISLINSSLNDTTPEIEGELDFEALYNLAKDSQIIPLVYYGLCKLDSFNAHPMSGKFLKAIYKLIFINENQTYEINKVFEELEKNSIYHLKMKGVLLKALYPHAEMRVMSDADVLIKEGQYEKIKPIMASLGYEECMESDHELIWTKNGFNVELHKRLIPSYNKDYYEYFGDGWRLAQTQDGKYGLEMSDEDHFIYLFTHFSKHYRDTGIGIKHLTDFYVYIKAKPQLNFEYIHKELEKLQLLNFWHNIKRLIDVWFNGAPEDEVSAFITHKIFKSKTYGTHETSVQSQAYLASKTSSVKEVKRKKLIRLIFMPYKDMCVKYKVLKKVPVLLPIMWVWRWIEAILFKRKNIKAQTKDLGAVTGEGVDAYKAELNFVGLDFNFEI